ATVRMAASATTRARRSGIYSGDLESEAVQACRHKAQCAEIDRSVEDNHDRDGDAEDPRDGAEAGEDERGAEEPDRTAQHPCDAARCVVFLAFDAAKPAGWFGNAPDELTDEIGRPPEAADEHDRAGEKERPRAAWLAEDETERDERNHRPLMRLAGR